MAPAVERLTAEEVALLAGETATAPAQVLTLDIFEAGESGFDYPRLISLIRDRIAFVPRFRQRVQQVPGRLVNPVWVDDADFDLTFHVRRSALPRPGSDEQLRELVARIAGRRLDHDRPLWETYLVEGLAGNRFAILAKSHLALVDGTTVDLAQLILDDTPEPPATPDLHWQPQRAPGRTELVTQSVIDAMRNPAVAADNARGRLAAGLQLTGRVRDTVETAIGRSHTPAGPLGAHLGEQRRLETVETELADYRAIRRELGGTVNDVVLAVVAGALRSWLLTRAEPVTPGTRLRTLVPLSVTDDDLAQPTSLGSRLTPHLLALPSAEPNPVMRLHQVSYALKAHSETGRAVAARRLAGVPGFAPTTFHALGARLAARHAPRSYALLVTNVPGPQFPLYAAGSRMVASFPVLPLAAGHALAIGATSYDGRVGFGLTADRDAVPDLTVLGQCLQESLAELMDVASGRGRVG